jgi:hypothetical protein
MIKTPRILIAGALAIGATTVAISYHLNRPSWSAVNEGPFQGVAWKPLHEARNVGRNPERLRSWQSWNDPYAFVYRVPSRDLRTSAFLKTANGDEVPLKTEATSDDGRLRSVVIPRNYPPGTTELDLIIKAPGHLPSEFKLLNPPSTIYRFIPDPMPSLRVDGITLESVAWSQPALGDARPVVVAAVRVADRLPKDVAWQMHVQFTQPFQSPTREEVTGGISVSDDFPSLKAPGIGYVIAQEWAGTLPTVQIKGAFATFAKTEEWVESGPVDVRAVKRRGAMGYELAQRGPLTLRLKDGAGLVLEPLMNHEFPFHVPKGDVLRVKASIKDPKATLLSGGHFGSQAKLAVQPGIGGSTFWDSAIVAFEFPNGKAGLQSLRLHLTRWRLLSDRTFILQPKVEHRGTANPEFAELGEKGATSGFLFFPSLDDFSKASSSHN